MTRVKRSAPAVGSCATGQATPAAGPLESATGDGWELRLGRWQDALAGVTCDAIVTDPPYGARTHENTRSLGNERADGYAMENLGPGYTAWTSADIDEFVQSWSPRCRGWIVTLTSHDLIPAWQAAHEAVGRYCFAPVPCVIRGMSVRLCGDGPSSWTVYAVVARPATQEFARWGTLDGAYVGGNGSHGRGGGTDRGGGRGKPSWLEHALVRDYSRPGDVVVDPMAGFGGALAAAVSLGRTAIGAEMDAAAFLEAKRRLARPLQIDMLAGLV